MICEVLDRLGPPLPLLLLISTVPKHGSTFIWVSPDSQFTTTHGVKQGCPMSCFLFLLLFEIPLCFFKSQGLNLSAYVDDVSVPVPRGAGPRVAATVQQGLALIGCQLNVTMSEALPLSLSSLPQPTSPKYAQLPPPLQAGTDFWTPVLSIGPPEWSDHSQHLLPKVSYHLHPGHHIPAHFNLQAAFRLIESVLLSHLADLNAHPSETLDRVLLVSTVVLPRLLYRCEYLPLTEKHLLSLTCPLERYVLGVAGMPSLIAQKTLYTHHKHSASLRCLCILQPTRDLDSLHSNVTLFQLRTTTTFHLCPFPKFLAALQLLQPHHPPSTLPLNTTLNARRQIQQANKIVSVVGLRDYPLPNSSTRPDRTYTDGSIIGFPPASGAAAILQDEHIAVCCVPSAPNSYKAGVLGVLLGSLLSAPWVHTPPYESIVKAPQRPPQVPSTSQTLTLGPARNVLPFAKAPQA